MSEYAISLASSEDTAVRVRLGLSGLLPTIGELQARSGLFDNGGAVSLTSGMSVEVSPFRAYVQGVSADGQGGYLAVLDTAKTLTFADGSGSNRTDLVLARVYDDTYDSSAATLFTVEIFEGTPGGGTPATPDNAIKLAEKVITPGMSAGSGGLGTAPTDTRPPRMVAAGGVVPVADATDRATLQAYDGLMVYRVDNDTIELRANGAWVVIYPVPRPPKVGTVSLAFNGAGEAALTHDLGVVPTYFHATHDSNGSIIVLTVKGGTLDTDTCVLQARKATDGTAYTSTLTTVRWIAVE